MMMMKLDDRDIVCEQDYTPLSNAELVEAIELHVAIMYTSPIIDFDLEWIIGPARALLARTEAAEAEAADAINDLKIVAAKLTRAERANASLAARVAELEAALGGLDALASDYDLPDGEAVAMAISDGRILTAGRRNIHGAVMGVMDVNRDNEALRARVAELEAEAAAQQWRPIDEPAPKGEIEVKMRCAVTDDGGIYKIRTDIFVGWWTSADDSEWRPLPPAPQEPTQ